jgi:hypothetical protein
MAVYRSHKEIPMTVLEKAHQMLHNTRRSLVQAQSQFSSTKSMLFNDATQAAEALYEAAPEPLRGWLRHLNLAEELLERGMLVDQNFRIPDMGRLELETQLQALKENWKGVVDVRFIVPGTTKDFPRALFMLLPPTNQQL